jgi:hypothetical protein
VSTVVVGEVAVGIVVVFDLDDNEYLGGSNAKCGNWLGSF